jgi:hypothetical protein
MFRNISPKINEFEEHTIYGIIKPNNPPIIYGYDKIYKNGKTINRSYTTNTGELKKRVRFNPNNLYQTTPKIISRLLTPYKKTIRRRGISSLPKRNKNNKKTRNYNYKK